MTLGILIIKTFAVIIGFSSALINDILNFKFLKDFKIDPQENRVFYLLAGINLISALVIASTFIFSIFYEIKIIDQETLLVGAIILSIVVFSEIIFRRIIMPTLTNYRIKKRIIEVDKIIFLRNLAFILNGFSLAAWTLLLLIFQFNILSG